MKRIYLLVLCLSSLLSFGQNEQIADNYFKQGEFEKALLSYQDLYKNTPNSKFFFKIIETLQQLEQYDQAKILLEDKLNNNESPNTLIEMGYNYQLMDSLDIAEKYYNKAIIKIEEKPYYAYMVARQFEKHSLLDHAIKVYKKAMELNPKKNYNIQLAMIYGEQGKVEQMFAGYLNYIEQRPEFLNNGKRTFSEFISEDPTNQNNIFLKRLLLKKIQTNPNIYWYELLSWLFIQEHDYDKAFIQEKALYLRNPESLNRMFELAITAMEEKSYESATEIFNYILENSQDTSNQLQAHQFLLDIKIATATPKDYKSIQKEYLNLFNTYGTQQQTLSLQLSYGHFLAFYLHQPEQASKFLKQTLKLDLSSFQEASVKLKLGDILVFQQRFNEALIYYSQIQANLKNSTIAQQARFKVAKTSYYKGDFDWAESQLKILKASTSQLIANDALDLKLLISDNKYEDSTQTALKLYAKADLMAYQNKTDEAISLLNTILKEHKGESIEDQALFKQAQLFEEKKQYDKAISNYQNIIAYHSDDILADDAYFFLAELYSTILKQPEKAKPLYEKILFNHEDSIYFVEARKKYRKLRGDTIN